MLSQLVNSGYHNVSYKLIFNQGGKHGILESYGIHRNPWNRTESTRILQNLAVLSLKALGCTLLQETLLKYVNN